MKRAQIKKRPIADTALATLEPEATEYRELDGNGLYFRVKPNGNKSWQLRYKKSSGKWSWLGIGAYPATSGLLARQRAAELQEDIAKGNNPIITKQERKQAELNANNATFEKLAYEWLNSKVNKWADNTMKNAKGALELHIFPTMGKRAFVSISPMEWLNLFKSIQKDKGLIDQANRIRTLCQEIYDLARVTGRIDSNPLERLNKHLDTATVKNMPHLSIGELPALLRAIRNYPTRDVAIGLQLLAMLFPRPSELRRATWGEFDLKERLWTIPAERMKKRRTHIIPLPDQAITLLNELHYLSGESPYLFPSRSSLNKPLSDMAFNMALRRLGYEGRQTPHGFRHIASTTLRERGFQRDHVEAALAHVTGGVEGVYNKAAYLADRTPMMQAWADYLDKLADDTVIQFKQA